MLETRNPMNKFQKQIESEFNEWKNASPNLIQRGMGIIGKPIAFILNPIIKKITPLLEGVLKGTNSLVVKVLHSNSSDLIDISTMSEAEFIDWLQQRDSIAQNWIIGGVSALVAEGGTGGFFGFAAVAAEIPISFASLLTFANKIALTYNLDISKEDVQIEVFKAITAGSATNVENKLEAISTFTAMATIVQKTTWKAMEQLPGNSLGGFIHAIRGLLQKLGINLTKRKAAQLIPGLGAVTGAAINGAWATDSLKAVKQYSRYLVTNSYYKKNGG